MAGDYAKDYQRDFGFFKDYSREALFLDEVFKLHGAGVRSILDIACGPGGHIVELARMGYRCAAADIDPEMLDLTRRAAVEQDLRIDTHEVDMRRFRIDAGFDAALNMFYSFQNVLFSRDEQLGFFRGVGTLLPVGGLFIIELLPEENNLRLYPPGQHFPVSSSPQEDGSILTVTSTSRIVDAATKEIVFLYETVHPDGTVQHEELVSPVRRVRLADFAELVDATSFITVGAYGECDVTVPFGQESAKLVAVLRKM